MGTDEHQRGEDAAEDVDAHRRAVLCRDDTEVAGAGAIERRHGERAVRAHDPGNARGEQREDEEHRADVAHHSAGSGENDPALGSPDLSAIDGEHRLHRVDEATEVGHLVGRQHQQDAEDRDAVEDHGGHGAAGDRKRDIFLRVGHLIARAAGQLEAHKLEHQHRHEQHDATELRCVVGQPETVDAVLHCVDDDRDREEAQQQEARVGADRGDPLADLERQDGREHADPDEEQGEDVEGDCVELGLIEEERREHRRGAHRESATEPDRVGDPVEEVVDRAGETPEGDAHPDVGATLLREGSAQLGEQECRRDEEDHRHDHHPGERAGPLGGHGADRVDTDKGADQEEQDVEATEVLAQLRLLDELCLSDVVGHDGVFGGHANLR